MPALTDIPLEVFIDHLLPLLPISDLLHLTTTCKFFATLCSDETFWRRKLQDEFNFSNAETARTSGWKFIYLRMANPRVYAWGVKANGRLGLPRFPKTTLEDVPFPLQLQIPGARIVSLVAGGMSFHALDSEGQIYVWGTLNGTLSGLRSDGFSEPSTQASSPLRLQLPTRTRSISCGRLHSSTMDSKNSIWTFLNWGRPFRLSSRRLSSPDSPPIQVECGWTFSSLLTKSGDVFIWWPFAEQINALIQSKMSEMDQEGNKQNAVDGVIPCACWDLEMDPYLLPPLPPLPNLSASDDAASVDTQIIQIAGFEDRLIVLTNHGHVLVFNSLTDETRAPRGSWQYLPNFSQVNRVRAHPTFANGNAESPADTMKITHISAHFRKFFAYSTGSSSVVLMGDIETTRTSDPTIIPALQNKSVISVVVGDYHYGALTAAGELLTWGAYSGGALGLGDSADLTPGTPGGFQTEQHRLRALDMHLGTPPDVQLPTPVRFDHHRKKPKERFCIAAAASGWHMGALVIDLEVCKNCTRTNAFCLLSKKSIPVGRVDLFLFFSHPQPNEDDEDSDVDNEMEVENAPSLDRRGHRHREQPHVLPIGGPQGPHILPFRGFTGRGASAFRIGFAGRGMPRGRGQ
ncbi:RCC1/BLIP-II [Dendrothele bispora CBS 962.96]|uniref:RCC1/BLIP-II n=1 Tax=Dendrothele bispora (strain CBS 962.96) TaxID=1314807 RepID=A0A4S8MR51_DENBC|nr:RCC1/BLIP-II [Dendrothele bispora CBS 962.96]